MPTSPIANKKILLIDDNLLGLRARKVVVEQLGFETTTASAPEEGLRLFSEHHFDLVITDFRMPGMNGTEVITHVRGKQPDVPIILISGLVEPLGLTEENTGADAVIAKSANEVNHLTRAINRLLKRRPVKKPNSSQGPGNRTRGNRIQLG